MALSQFKAGYKVLGSNKHAYFKKVNAKIRRHYYIAGMAQREIFNQATGGPDKIYVISGFDVGGDGNVEGWEIFCPSPVK